jgi:two-component system sensor histidine kinase/response regulator
VQRKPLAYNSEHGKMESMQDESDTSNQQNGTAQDILIVDDKAANLRFLSQVLTEQGYDVRAATSGARALQSARTTPPDLILLDIKMPDMDGYEICQRLKADEQTRDTPVIFISALGDPEDKISAFGTGGVDYITKPFQVEEVLARVRIHLGLRHLQTQLQQTNSELAQRIDELAHSNAELQARNEELDAFAHTVAHDLKNPLSAITLHTSWMKDSWSTLPIETVQESLSLIARSADKVNGIVDELLLLLASIRKEEVQITPLDTANIVAEAQERLTKMIDEYEAKIITPKTWPVALGYAPWIEEVWSNYISNAIKYGGQPPRVEVSATILSDPSMSKEHATADSITQTGQIVRGQVRFCVRDNGQGLTPEEQLRLFTPFERLDPVRAQGYGLGLSVVRRIVEKLGGQVGVESEAGQGSEFYFTLPSAPESGLGTIG